MNRFTFTLRRDRFSKVCHSETFGGKQFYRQMPPTMALSVEATVFSVI